jgi:hypothetical protein
MKTLVFVSALLVLASCDIYVVDPEPVYIDYRDRFTGTFEISEYSSTYDEHWDYGMSIYKTSSDGASVVIENFYNSGLSVRASVDINAIYIPLQVVDGYQVHGSGTLSGGKLTIQYYVLDTFDYHGVKDYCNATGWRI